jgi:alpha-galactosidase
MRNTTPPWKRAAWAAFTAAAFIVPLAAYAQDPAVLSAPTAPANSLWLDTLNLSNVTQDYGTPHAGKSVDNNPLTINGTVYAHGLGTHAVSRLLIDLKGRTTKFEALAGVDDERKGQGSVQFQVFVDGNKKLETPVLHGGDAPAPISVDLTGAKRLILVVTDGGDGNTNDHADWGGALFTLVPGAADTLVTIPDMAANEPPMPISMDGDSPVPAIHGPRITGATVGKPFEFMIPATGEGPLTFEAANLPAGLTLDKNTGIISGTLPALGSTLVHLTVRGPRGSSKRSLTIVGGSRALALTPPMGWNSWNVWAGAVTDQKVRDAADQLIAAGLSAHGFQYVNLDDTWEAGRDANGVIQTNKKFPDMKGMVDYIHSKGLKFGIYSSPGPTTCGGYTASWQHEQQDADTYAGWGVDYLKYDWCSYGDVATGEGLERQIKPYRLMGAALRSTNRDILYSLCQYGMADVWKWGATIGANCWRTTGDIQDNWSSLRGIFTSQAGHEDYVGPGYWNDPDMLMVGIVGFGNTHPTHLKPNEQITHISMWSLLSSPLLIGCDLTRLDAFTKALLTNDDVLDVNQDPLGRPAGRIAESGDAEIWARPLFDDTKAVGLVNLGSEKMDISVSWAQLGLSGPQPVRDLWQRKDIGTFRNGYTVSVPSHGTVLIKVGKPSKVE